MPTVVLASAIARWQTAAPSPRGDQAFAAHGTTVREVLDHFFADHPTLRDYVLDERGALRHHVVCFVNGTAIADKLVLADPVPPTGEVYLFQALSGG